MLSITTIFLKYFVSAVQIFFGLNLIFTWCMSTRNCQVIDWHFKLIGYLFAGKSLVIISKRIRKHYEIHLSLISITFRFAWTYLPNTEQQNNEVWSIKRKSVNNIKRTCHSELPSNESELRERKNSINNKSDPFSCPLYWKKKHTTRAIETRARK